MQTSRDIAGDVDHGPNTWVVFPTFHGEREKFNGFCEDKVRERKAAFVI